MNGLVHDSWSPIYVDYIARPVFRGARRAMYQWKLLPVGMAVPRPGTPVAISCLQNRVSHFGGYWTMFYRIRGTADDDTIWAVSMVGDGS